MANRPLQVGDKVRLRNHFEKDRGFMLMGDHRRQSIRALSTGVFTVKSIHGIPRSGEVDIHVDVGMFYLIPESILDIVE